VTAIRVEMPDKLTADQLSSRLSEDAEVIADGDRFTITLDADQRELHTLFSELRDGVAAFDLLTVNVEIDGQRYLLQVA
jgi:hypothetical protein